MQIIQMKTVTMQKKIIVLTMKMRENKLMNLNRQMKTPLMNLAMHRITQVMKMGNQMEKKKRNK